MDILSILRYVNFFSLSFQIETELQPGVYFIVPSLYKRKQAGKVDDLFVFLRLGTQYQLMIVCHRTLENDITYCVLKITTIAG